MKRKLAIGAGWMTALQLLSKVIEVGFIAILARIALACTLVVAPAVLKMRDAGLPPIAILVAAGSAITTLAVILILWRPRWLLGGFVLELLDDAERLTERFRKRKAL